MKWFGPEEIETLSAEADARVGGRFHIVMHDVSDEEHYVSGIYREVVPNEELVFTRAWRSTLERESLVTMSIKPDGAGSLLTLTHEQFFDAGPRPPRAWLARLPQQARALSFVTRKRRVT